MISVLVADDHEMVRAGFRMILDAQDDITVVADVADGEAAVRRARELRPDVCLVDIRMPGLDGLRVTELLAPQAKVVVVTTFDTDENLHRALENGASGFLTKDAGPALLVESVRAAARGDVLISPDVTLRVLRSWTRPSASVDVGLLTPRERDVVREVARGLGNREIGDALHLSLSTVKTHLAAAQGKTGARNRVELAAWAFRARLVEP
ncbi:response regulator transcription factor [Actinosynnema pretiosum subsp. pretiosum]|uniref:Two component transcriptional regulator, LuxR family n=2 Tax=Actinosynnema TaxID=40566 RepID=C6W8M8_ACTMD|nr:response regulator transcription factor [Actinosynnema mirum]ACU37127.1 two component transcriptional regulator, LuxR family [Actinosynnema mirum DSM 43827]AXX30617.1 two-component system response regulator [Actinosynnema pretiosum subsp. pretiosum]QUF05255.1 response regulator transcription factor [Actinosynnema pretiosum subsp. pretiosum]